ncbi:DUF559 domain-containing protein [Nocardioides humilatus]|uniref:DUF559 domain-containing protein n=1 Tax=Nocardioides humilatus TaxID=2607660 RepID=A0A5B1LBQ8_9ACTN|nr:DUF559 domain-containing protein [Nocardioides humilatus]KAA1417057.1 DUF559 domain-containing protein [Nocardioides humilatus]
MSRSALDKAILDGKVARVARGRYVVAAADEAIRTAYQVSGVLCLTSAALFHGWAVKQVPELPDVSFRRNRKLTDAQLRVVRPHRHDLAPDDVVRGIATSKEVTLLQCLRSLPDDEALAIADSAARAGELAALARVRAMATGRGAARVRAKVDEARADPANAFESVLRSIANSVEGLRVEPQRWITSVQPWARPDLVDEDLRIVLEADSFEWHGDRAALRRDARRYDLLTVDGWIVLRFAWEDVMFDQDFVRAVLVAAVELANGRTKVVCATCGAA